MTTDAPARARVVGDLARNVVVEAGAGSGKTTAIVDRVVALVSSGVGIESIVAVTFTEAAASDLRARVRVKLERVAAANGADAPTATVALADLDAAPIGTLHGWARRILAEFPLPAGLPPRFDLLDDVRSSLAATASWHAFLDDALVDPALEDSIGVLDAAQYRLFPLRNAFEAIREHPDRIAAVRRSRTRRPLVVNVEPVLDAIGRAVPHLESCLDETDKLAAHLKKLEQLASALGNADHDLDRIDLLLAPEWKPPSGRKSSWPDADAVRAAAGEVHDSVEAVRHTAVAVATHNVLDRALAHLDAEREQRRRDGELVYADLLVLARDVLRSDPDVRRRLHNRYSTVILDEFQDTDPIQIELAVLIATDTADIHDLAWTELPVPAGRLVVVGDPKQSIYRFRRADLSVFRRVLDLYADDRVEFIANFRSRAPILEWIDHCIGPQFDEGDPAIQADARPLEAVRESDESCVWVLGTEVDGLVEQAREQEATDLATLLTEVAAGLWTVENRDGSARPARLADCAILLPTRVGLPILERAFDAARIPVRIESETLVFGTQTVRELVAMLEAVADPLDSVAVVAALRSPAFACRDDELALYALASGSWNYLRPVSESTPPTVRAGLEWLRAAHERQRHETVDATVEGLIRERHVLELGLASARPRDHWRRAQHIADLARTFADDGGTGLREFVAWLRERAEADWRQVEVPFPEPDDDAVRILTVHGAKGLEFPITILAGLNVGDRSPTSPVLWDADGWPVLTGTGLRQPGFDDLVAPEKAANTAEAVRLLYVAATRARDHLVVSLHRKAKSNCPAGRLAELLDTAPQLARQWEPSDVSTLIIEPTKLGAALDLDSWSANRAALLDRASRPAAISATKLTASADEPGADAEFDRAAAGTHAHAGAASALGRAVHAALQTVDFTEGAPIEAVVEAAARAESVAADEVEPRVRSALATPTLRAAALSARCWRELPVAATVDGVLVEGYIDLGYDDGDGLIVVDYKTDAVTDTDLDGRADQYAVQLGAYVLALEAAASVTVARCVLVFARPDGAVEREVPVATARDRARAQLAALTEATS